MLFLCTGNSARSQIAEALLMKKGGDRFVVASAGAKPVKEVRPEAIAVLRGQGIDWTGKKPKGFDAVVKEEWDIVITLCDRMKESCPALPTRPVTAHWGVPDPSEVEDAKERSIAFAGTLGLLSWRLDLMLSLRLDSFESWVLENRLQSIPSQAPPEETDGSDRSKKKDR